MKLNPIIIILSISFILATVCNCYSGETSSLTLEDLKSWAESARSAIVSVSLSYELEEYYPVDPRFDEASVKFKEDIPYLRGPRIEKSLNTFQYKNTGQSELWKTTSRNILNPSDYPAGTVLRYGLDHNIAQSFDGEHYYYVSKARGVQPRIHMGGPEVLRRERYAFERLGIPTMFSSDEVYRLFEEQGGVYRIDKAENNLIQISVYKEDALVQSATISLEYGGKCLNEVNYQSFRHRDTRRLYTFPNIRSSFDDYRMIAGIWYPFTVREEYDRVNEVKEDADSHLLVEMEPSSWFEIKIIDCELNISLDDISFSLNPERGMQVYDEMLGFNYLYE